MNRILLGATALMLAVPAVAQLQAPPMAPMAPPMAPMAQRMDVTQTRDQAVARVRDHFARMDVNRDGFVAGDEMRSMRGKRMAQGARAGGDPTRAFDRLDANRDGMISREEFGRVREMRQQRRSARADAPGAAIPGERRGQRMGKRMGGGMMRMADLDRDGRVSLQEATTSALQRFDRIDANRDGRITPDERQRNREMRKAMRGQRAG